MRELSALFVNIFFRGREERLPVAEGWTKPTTLITVDTLEPLEHTIRNASGFRPGESIVVFGAGPVGLMAAYSAVLRGASEVYVVDRVPERLAKAKEIGCTPIDFSKSDPVDQIKALRGGKEVDRGVDAVGYQATTGDGKTEQPNAMLEGLIRVVRPTGGLGIPGLYAPSDPGAPDAAAAKGYISFPFGKLFEKGLSIGTGECNVKIVTISPPRDNAIREDNNNDI
ncbi:hypothetical protein C8R47DRAFT_1206179 [Mycena vitilis]|nr:hypothetical protein C8R47DRAFT_1206179 [Mycena vitilis]